MGKYHGKCPGIVCGTHPDPHARVQVSMYSSYDLYHPG